MGHASGDGAEVALGMAANDALEALRWNWGEAYEIEITHDGWRARRRDGLGSWLAAPSAEDLRNQILSDYLAKPVPRPPAKR